MNSNPYIPNLVRIEEIIDEVKGERAIKTFKVVFIDEELRKSFNYKPGQCAMLSLFGQGECFFAISSTPTRAGYLEFSIMKLGKVTSALHLCEKNEILGLRGPYGNSFPVEEWVGKNIIFIGGGIGQAPLRSVINYMLDNRKDYDKLTVIYGARTTSDLCYKKEIFELENSGKVDVHLSIDVEEPGWNRFVGFVPNNLMRVKPSPNNAIALTCGPPIMIKYVLQNLKKLGFKDEQIYTTLEYRMKCGIGKCGRCNIGNLYVCKDGPVFNLKQLQTLPGEVI
ncbi:MAG: FAD/NAD(P)-binding protein [Candidatus Thermoplasmatota archaeon]